MFDVGGSELLLVLVVALVVLGPEKLPEAARMMGKLTGRAKALFNNLRYELEREAYNKELQEKFDAKMREMGIDPESLKEPGATPKALVEDSPAARLLEPDNTSNTSNTNDGASDTPDQQAATPAPQPLSSPDEKH